MGIYFFNSGKNNKLFYYIKNGVRLIVPKAPLRKKLKKTLDEVNRRPDKEYILERVAYYNKLEKLVSLGGDSPALGAFDRKENQSAYFFDSYEYVRWFDPDLKWNFLFGDVIHVPDTPSIVKSRPIEGDNANSVLLNLDKVRHFVFLKDKTPFRAKMDKSIFRGHIIGKPHRIRFMEMFYGNPMCDAGIISPIPEFPAEWTQKKITLWDHLKYKFVLALEGNDVASNLKWIMSSNSLPVMPRPVYETWFMEGTLKAGYHYVEIEKDYSDLEEKLNYYIEHPEEAEAITRHAHEYIGQFLDKKREKLISLLVLAKYFRMTGQIGE